MLLRPDNCGRVRVLTREALRGLLCEDICNEAPGTLETIKQPPRKDAGMTEAGSRDRLCVLWTAGLAMPSFFTVISSQSAFARQQAGSTV